jgi:hypothetical protein
MGKGSRPKNSSWGLWIAPKTSRSVFLNGRSWGGRQKSWMRNLLSLRQQSLFSSTNKHLVHVTFLEFHTGWWSGVRVPVGAGNFSLRHCVQTGSGAHPASYPMRIRGSFSVGKAAGAWSWPLISIKNAWCYAYTHSIRLHGVVLKAQGQLYLYLTWSAYSDEWLLLPDRLQLLLF